MILRWPRGSQETLLRCLWVVIGPQRGCMHQRELAWLQLGCPSAGACPALADPGQVAGPASRRARWRGTWKAAAGLRGGSPGTALALRARRWSSVAAAGGHGYARAPAKPCQGFKAAASQALLPPWPWRPVALVWLAQPLRVTCLALGGCPAAGYDEKSLGKLCPWLVHQSVCRLLECAWPGTSPCLVACVPAYLCC